MRIMMAAGGTGGHVFPAISIAQEVQKKNPQSSVIFVGTKNGFEANLVPEFGFPIEFVEISGIHSKSLGSKMKSILRMPKALHLSHGLLNKYRPDVVFGIGGYVSGPLLLMAALKKTKTAILEPNAIAGSTNRFLGKICDTVFLAFDQARHFFPEGKSVYSGNPIRSSILSIPPPTFAQISKHIFIFGGSQGASKINRGVVDMLERDPSYWKQHRFTHQTGKKDHDEIKSIYSRYGFNADVRPFFNRIEEAYRESDFIIARSGSSVVEIAATGRPSLLVPYPYAADDHQRANAEIFSGAGAAHLLLDHDCTGQRLEELLRPTLESTDQLKKMSSRALEFRKEASASVIADHLQKLVQS